MASVSDYAATAAQHRADAEALGFVVGAAVVVSNRIEKRRMYGPFHTGRRGSVKSYHPFGGVYVDLEPVGRKGARNELFDTGDLDLQ